MKVAFGLICVLLVILGFTGCVILFNMLGLPILLIGGAMACVYVTWCKADRASVDWLSEDRGIEKDI